MKDKLFIDGVWQAAASGHEQRRILRVGQISVKIPGHFSAEINTLASKDREKCWR